MASSQQPGTVTAPFLCRTLVLIPALNEASCVGETIRAWRLLGAGRVRVVDNGSTDDTVDCALNSGAEVLFEQQRGYGAATWRGLRDWPDEFEWVMFSSADGSDRLSAADAQDWQRAIDAGTDIILGDRTCHPSARALLKPIQRLGNWLCCRAIAQGWGRTFRDMASMRLVRRAVFDRMKLCDRGFGWNVEMQVRALELGLHMVELPVDYHPRRAGKSKISGSFFGTMRAGYGIARMLVYLWWLRTGREIRQTGDEVN